MTYNGPDVDDYILSFCTDRDILTMAHAGRDWRQVALVHIQRRHDTDVETFCWLLNLLRNTTHIAWDRRIVPRYVLTKYCRLPRKAYSDRERDGVQAIVMHEWLDICKKWFGSHLAFKQHMARLREKRRLRAIRKQIKGDEKCSVFMEAVLRFMPPCVTDNHTACEKLLCSYYNVRMPTITNLEKWMVQYMVRSELYESTSLKPWKINCSPTQFHEINSLIMQYYFVPSLESFYLATAPDYDFQPLTLRDLFCCDSFVLALKHGKCLNCKRLQTARGCSKHMCARCCTGVCPRHDSNSEMRDCLKCEHRQSAHRACARQLCSSCCQDCAYHLSRYQVTSSKKKTKFASVNNIGAKLEYELSRIIFIVLSK